jgi:hypothetical protein
VADPGLVSRLHEVIAALDRRRPRPERPGEAAIVRAADELRSAAIARLAALDIPPPSPVA